jgi:hypothetical protein
MRLNTLADSFSIRVLLSPGNSLRQRHGFCHQPRHCRQDDGILELCQSTERNCPERYSISERACSEWYISRQRYCWWHKWAPGQFCSCKPNSLTTLRSRSWIWRQPRRRLWSWRRCWCHGRVYLQLSLRPGLARYGRSGWIYSSSKCRSNGQKGGELLENIHAREW